MILLEMGMVTSFQLVLRERLMGLCDTNPKISHFYLLSMKQLEGCRSDCQSLGSCQVSGVSEISGTSFTDRGRSGDFFGTLEA